MKIVSHYMESIAGVQIYPIIAFIIFFLFFLAVTLYVIRMDKSYIREVSNYALDGDQDDNNIDITQ